MVFYFWHICFIVFLVVCYGFYNSGKYFAYLSNLNYIGVIFLSLFLATVEVDWSTNFEEIPPQNQISLESPPNDQTTPSARRHQSNIQYGSIP